MMDWLDEVFGWVRVIATIVAGPLLIIAGLVSGHGGYAVIGALVTIFGAFIAKSVFGK
jgi:hypothetical protein